MTDKRVAVLIPCYNEEVTIGKVIDDFKQALPNAVIYVYDNNSTDDSVTIAVDHGACVAKCPVQGKGAVIKQMFREVDADYYFIVDADDTYPVEYYARMMLQLMVDNNPFDMIIGDRLSANYYDNNKRKFHGLGNTLVRFLVNFLFHGKAYDFAQDRITPVPDIMTGYRLFSRRFVKNILLHSDGFEVETEMTINAIKVGYHIGTLPVPYKDRPTGSYSKLSTFSDGRKVLRTIFISLFR